MERHRDQDLELIRKTLLRMGGLVERQIREAMQALVERDTERAGAVIRLDDEVDDLQKEIDGLCSRTLALQQPMAVDMRFLVSTMKIATDLERMGDLSVNIARSSLRLLKHSPPPGATEIPEMAKQVQEMVRTAVEAIENADDERARHVLRADDSVDALKNRMFEHMVHGIEADAAAAATNVDLIFIAHSLERIADHATNIAEDVLFFVKGVEVRHRTSIGS